MRKLLAATAIAGSIAAGLAMAPAANAQSTATATAAQSQSGIVGWKNLFSSDGKAYTRGVVQKTGPGAWRVSWKGFDKVGGKKGYAWFRYQKNGHWKSRVTAWDGTTGTRHFELRGIKKLFTYTCWAGKTANCGQKLWLIK
ncbi:hypothetical protein [Nonomuraea endophytica]|uniref:Uncharacterized protein n=1 Tax=Nonomuraea endophytica TaxID=714136 RepID=A0A7W8ABP3_9ACTN|nr:hypothetical protein [Nonomuraea endophytica]MBB5081813.1 hypothetical protein [Nonomuraea endophytica]